MGRSKKTDKPKRVRGDLATRLDAIYAEAEERCSVLRSEISARMGEYKRITRQSAYLFFGSSELVVELEALAKRLDPTVHGMTASAFAVETGGHSPTGLASSREVAESKAFQEDSEAVNRVPVAVTGAHYAAKVATSIAEFDEEIPEFLRRA